MLWDVSLITLVDIFSNPLDLEIHVCGTIEKKWSIMILRSPKNNSRILFSALEKFQTKEEAVEFLEGFLHFIYNVLNKTFNKPGKDIFVFLLKAEMKSKKMLNPELIQKIKEEIIEKGEAKTYKF